MAGPPTARHRTAYLSDCLDVVDRVFAYEVESQQRELKNYVNTVYPSATFAEFGRKEAKWRK